MIIRYSVNETEAIIKNNGRHLSDWFSFRGSCYLFYLVFLSRVGACSLRRVVMRGLFYTPRSCFKL